MCNPVTTRRPDVLLAKGEHADLQFEVTKNDLGYRCGYVRLPKGHPWHGRDYSDEALWDVAVHGGLTFAAPDSHCGKGGEDDAWWLGFDCGHLGDAPDPQLMDGKHIAADIALERAGLGRMMHGDVIRSTEYVVAECHRLCDQAARRGERGGIGESDLG